MDQLGSRVNVCPPKAVFCITVPASLGLLALGPIASFEDQPGVSFSSQRLKQNAGLMDCNQACGTIFAFGSNCKRVFVIFFRKCSAHGFITCGSEDP